MENVANSGVYRQERLMIVNGKYSRLQEMSVCPPPSLQHCLGTASHVITEEVPIDYEMCIVVYVYLGLHDVISYMHFDWERGMHHDREGEGLAQQ